MYNRQISYDLNDKYNFITKGDESGLNENKQQLKLNGKVWEWQSCKWDQIMKFRVIIEAQLLKITPIEEVAKELLLFLK